MTAQFSYKTGRSNRCCAVASCAASSAPVRVLLDTADLLVVSIFVLCLLVLRIMLPIG